MVRSKTKSAPDWKQRAMDGAYGLKGKKHEAETNKQFIADCESEGVKPTARQFAKWAKKMRRWAT